MSKYDKEIAFLRSYLLATRKAKQLNDELQALFLPQSPRMDGMPRGSDTKDLSGIVTRSEKLRRDLQIELAQVYAVRTAVLEAIEDLPEAQALVLRYRYIQIDEFRLRLRPWDEIAEQTGYCYSRVLQIHREGLRSLHLKIYGG